jgi:hypothetical protein
MACQPDLIHEQRTREAPERGRGARKTVITLVKKSTAFGEVTILLRRTTGSHIYQHEDWFQSEADRNGSAWLPTFMRSWAWRVTNLFKNVSKIKCRVCYTLAPRRAAMLASTCLITY